MTDLSWHLTNLYLRGRDGRRLLDRLATNRFETIRPGQAKQFLACALSGFVIGDAVAFCLDDETFLLVGNDLTLNWVEFHAHTGSYDVTVERHPTYALNSEKRRTVFRFEVEGPFALELLETVTRKSHRDLPFLRTSPAPHRRQRGRGAPPQHDRCCGVRVVRPLGSMRKSAHGDPSGWCTISAAPNRVARVESGWFPGPIPAIYTGDDLQPYREWLPATVREASRPLNGSFYSDRIEDNYTSPFELGYGKLIDWQHDFIGSDALAKMQRTAQRRKVMLVWDRNEVARLLRMAICHDPAPVKYLELPLAQYGSRFDRVEDSNERLVGLSHCTGFLSTEGTVVSIALLDRSFAVPGTIVTVVWGEAEERRARGWADEHTLFGVRARVTLPPLNPLARTYQSRR